MSTTKQLEASTQTVAGALTPHAPYSKDLEKQFVPCGIGSVRDRRDNVAEIENIVDWEDSEDLENPLNWPTKKKATAIGIVSLITIPLASTIISSATPDVMHTFNSTNETLGAFVTSVYLLGYVAGPLLLAPLSETHGRAVVYNVCNFIFLVFNIACALANSLGSLIAFRFFAGIAASCPITLGMGTVADLVRLESRGKVTGLLFLGPLLGPTAAPLIGAYLAKARSWRWIFWLVSILAGSIFLLTLVFIRETYAYVILERKTMRLRKETGNMKLRSALSTGKTPKENFRRAIIRPLKMLSLSPIVLSLSLYTAVVYGYLYLMFVTFPTVFEGTYGFSSTSVGLTYLGVGVGSIFGLIFCAAMSDRTVKVLTKRNGGASKPEYRLPPLVIGAFIIPFGLFLYGWSAEKHWHWMVPIIGSGFLGGGMFFCFMPIGVYFIDTFGAYSASATAANTVLRSLLGALLPLAGDSMYSALGVGWGTSVLGFIAVAFIPVSFIFLMFGERIRRLTRVEF